MIGKARSLGSRVQFTVGDVRDWVPDPSTDVVISNATLHWVPGHADLIAGWVRRLRVGSCVALQVPGNFDAPSHRELREVARRPRWRGRVAHLVREPDVVLDPSGYAALLRAEGCAVDAWETSYLHLLPSEPPSELPSEWAGEAEHPVLRWMEGTALRPIRAALGTGADWASFCGELRTALAQAYPVREGIVYFPFRRVFCVATVAATMG
jgi:trans-aconitate 2-methyltransferase